MEHAERNLRKLDRVGGERVSRDYKATWSSGDFGVATPIANRRMDRREESDDGSSDWRRENEFGWKMERFETRYRRLNHTPT